MGTNHYFNQYSPAVINEQRLMEDLIVESIKIHGHNIYYMPRESYNEDDDILGENAESKFARAYLVEMYIQTFKKYDGQNEFMSKFGLEVRDNATFVVSRRSFERYVPSNIATRPREGDLIYVPVLRSAFEIKFVEEEQEFFSLGKRTSYSYYLSTEKFRFSNENIETTIEEIDELQTESGYTITITTGAGNSIDYMIGEDVYQGSNVSAANAKALVSDWNSSDNTLKVINIKGVFANDVTLIGNTSNAQYLVSTIDTLSDVVWGDEYDNKAYQTGSDILAILTETNPFGTS